MQIAIEVPDDFYERVNKDGCMSYTDAEVVVNAFYIGKPYEERKTGKWKPFDLTWGRSIYSCTACFYTMDVPTEMSKPIYRFCPNCGAKMEESDG